VQFVADQVLVGQALPGRLRFSFINLILPILHNQFRSLTGGESGEAWRTYIKSDALSKSVIIKKLFH